MAVLAETRATISILAAHPSRLAPASSLVEAAVATVQSTLGIPMRSRSLSTGTNLRWTDHRDVTPNNCESVLPIVMQGSIGEAAT
jgi:hypothetical protein